MDLNTITNEYQVVGSDKIAVGIFLFTYKRLKNGSVKVTHSLYKKGYLDFLTERGYLYFAASDSVSILIKRDGCIIRSVTMQDIINEIDEFYDVNIPDFGINYSKFELEEIWHNQRHLVTNDKFLFALDRHENFYNILRDTSDKTYFFFKNGIVEVSSREINLMPYSGYESHYSIWESQVINHDIDLSGYCTHSEFYRFMQNVCNNDPVRFDRLQTAVGYLVNTCIDKSARKAVIFYDEQQSRGTEANGRTGKGLMANAIGKVRNVSAIDGKSFNADNQFKFQSVNIDTNVVFIDDPKENLKFEVVHSAISEGIIVEQKFVKPFTLDTAKILIASNYRLKGSGATNTDRQYPVIFSDYYSSMLSSEISQPVVYEHGGRFFEWETTEEWNSFYLVLMQSAQFFHQNGLK